MAKPTEGLCECISLRDSPTDSPTDSLIDSPTNLLVYQMLFLGMRSTSGRILFSEVAASLSSRPHFSEPNAKG